MRNLIIVLCTAVASFKLNAQPVISSFIPDNGPVGITVTISGYNFNSTASENHVYFGAVRATVSSATATSLTVVVPKGTTYQPISVTTNSLTGYSNKPFIITFEGGLPIKNTGNSQNSFEPLKRFNTDYLPNNVTISDFDGDGKPDIATSNNYITNGSPASVSILKNISAKGSISFSPKSDINTGAMTFAVAAGDLNGDGKPDLISTSIVDQTVSVLKNTSTIGNISFAPKIDFPSGDNPYSIGIGDFDRDGKPDLAVANNFSNTVSIYRNIGSGGNISFAPKFDISTALKPFAVVVGDFDGDGRVDLAASNEYSNSVSVFKNTSTTGSISFALKVDYTTGGSPYGIAAGDINNDGLPDLVVANNSTSDFSVLRNISIAGSISFAQKVDLKCANDPTSVSLSDLNGDGKIDIVIPSINPSVHQNNSSGTSISTSSSAYLWIGASKVNMVALGDLDGDGKADIAGSNFSADWVSVLRNKNNEPTIGSFTPTSAAAGDVITIFGANLSGVTDVRFGGVPAESFSIIDDTKITAIAGAGSSGDISVSNQYGTQSLPNFIFLAPPVISDFSPLLAGSNDTVTISGSKLNGTTAVSFGGIPATAFTVVNDSTIRVVVGVGATGEVAVTAYSTATKPGFTFVPPPSISSVSPTLGNTGTLITITGTNFSTTTQVKIGGVSASSYTVLSSTTIEAIVADGGSGSISVTTIGGTAYGKGFVFPRPVVASFFPTAGPVGTLVTINGSNFRYGIANNIVHFGAVKANIIEATTTSLTVEVPSGSTYLPITVTTNGNIAQADKPFNLTFNYGNSSMNATSFSWDSAFLSPDSPRKMVMSDLDGDGKSDIITSNYDLGTITAIRNTTNNGIISFSPPVNISSSFGWNVPINICMADITNDGKLDIIASCHCGIVAVFKNTSTPGTISFAPKVNLPTVTSHSITTGDFDNDGKIDIAVYNIEIDDVAVKFVYNILIFKNTGSDDIVSFELVSKLPVDLRNGTSISAADMDGDGKSDLVMATERISIFRNTSDSSTISFAPQVNFPGSYPKRISIADLDGDGKNDIVTPNSLKQNTYSIFKNTSSIGSLNFAPASDYDLGDNTGSVYVGNLDGDDKPDMAIISSDSKKVVLLKNISTANNIVFEAKAEIATQLKYNWIAEVYFGDLDGNGRQDIAVASYVDDKISIFKNNIGNDSIPACIGGNATITSNLTGTSYQWQLRTENGFANIFDNNHYQGTNNETLQLSDIPATFHSYQYRCVVNGNSSFEYKLTLPSPPTITANGSTIICSGDNVVLTSSASSGNQWYFNGTIIDSANRQSFTASEAGTYAVAVTDEVCTNLIDTIVEVLTTQIASIATNGPTTICSGDSVVLTSSASVGNQWYFNGIIIDSSNKQSITASESGTYKLTVTTDGCTNSIDTIVEVITTEKPSISASGSTTICLGDKVVLTSSASSGNQWYLNGVIVDSAKEQTITVSVAGIYTVAVTTDGCTNSIDKIISVHSTQLPTITTNYSGCPSRSIEFKANVYNAGNQYEINWFVNDLLLDSSSIFNLNDATNGTRVYAKLISTTPCINRQTITSDTTTLNCIEMDVPNIDSDEIHVGPNPTNGLLYIKIQLNSLKKVSFYVTDILGNKIYSSGPTISSEITEQIDFSNNYPGVYLLIVNIDGKLITKRIIVN